MSRRPSVSTAIRDAVVGERLTYAAAAERVYGVSNATTRARVSAHMHTLQRVGVVERIAKGAWVMAASGVPVDTADEGDALAKAIDTAPDFFTTARARSRARVAVLEALAGLRTEDRVRVLCDLVVAMTAPISGVVSE